MAHIDNPSKEAIELGYTRISHHTTHDMANFPTFRRLSTPYRIYQVQGEVNITRYGSINLTVQSATGHRSLQLTEVLYIPSVNFNLFSLQKVIKAKCIPVFDELHNKCVITKNLPTRHKEQIAILRIIDGRLTLECHLAPHTPLAPTTSALSTPALSPAYRGFATRLSTEIAARFDAEPNVAIIREKFVTGVMDASHFAEGKEAVAMVALAAFNRLNESLRIDMQVRNRQDIKDWVGNCFTLHLKCVFTKQEADFVKKLFADQSKLP